MDRFFCGRSAADRGTLYNIKNVFNHRGVKKESKECFNHAWDFLAFVTKGYVCLAAVELLQLHEPEDTPSDMPPQNSTPEELQKYIRELATRIVNMAWVDQRPDVRTVVDVDAPPDEPQQNLGNEPLYPFCICSSSTFLST